jgi:hypothetical protein
MTHSAEMDQIEIEQMIADLYLSPSTIPPDRTIELKPLNIRTSIGYIFNDVIDQPVPESIYNTSSLSVFILRLRLELEVFRLTKQIITIGYHFDREFATDQELKSNEPVVFYRLYFEVKLNHDYPGLSQSLSSMVDITFDLDESIQTRYLAPLVNIKLLNYHQIAWIKSTFNLIKWSYLRLIDECIYLEITAIADEQTFTSIYNQYSRWFHAWIQVGMSSSLISMSSNQAETWNCRPVLTKDLSSLVELTINQLDINPLNSLIDQVKYQVIDSSQKYDWQSRLIHSNIFESTSIFNSSKNSIVGGLYLPRWSELKVDWNFMDDRIHQRPYFYRLGNSPVVYHHVSLIQPEMWVIDGWIEVKLDSYIDLTSINDIILAMAEADGTVETKLGQFQGKNSTVYYLGPERQAVTSYRWKIKSKSIRRT